MTEEMTTPQEETQKEVQNETQEEVEVNEYDKAWETIDTEKDFVEIVDEPLKEEAEPSQEQQGLVITNPVLKYKGKEIPIESEQELINLAQKGFKLELEMSKIKPAKRLLATIEENGITNEDIQALADLKNGKSNAIQYFKQLAGIEETSSDTLWGDDEPKEEYKPEPKQVDEVQEIFQELSADNPSLAGKVAEAYNQLDDEFKMLIYSPAGIRNFIKSVETGEFDMVYPVALKLKTINQSLSWSDAYVQAGIQLQSKKQKADTPDGGVKLRTNKETKRTIPDDYDRAFDMSIEELERQLFS